MWETANVQGQLRKEYESRAIWVRRIYEIEEIERMREKWEKGMGFENFEKGERAHLCVPCNIFFIF